MYQQLQHRVQHEAVVECWANVVDGGPTLNQVWQRVSREVRVFFIITVAPTLAYLVHHSNLFNSNKFIRMTND